MSQEEQAIEKLHSVREKGQELVERLRARELSTEETLREMRITLDKWDTMKARFSDALDSAIHRIAEQMKEQQLGLNGETLGPPIGPLAHGFDAARLHADGTFMADRALADPKLVVECSEVARPKMHAGIAAHEYHDAPDVLRSKVKILAGMLRRSRSTVAYTGAGISTAAGIADYASRAGSRSSVLPKKLSDGTPYEPSDAIDLEPTYAHHALVALHAKGMLDLWVQQNHDGLPQKAGYPQDAINEIHGSWFDPTNPVVPMDGALRPELMRQLNDAKASADLVLVLGTSLSGVNADSLVSAVGQRRLEVAEATGAEPEVTKDGVLGAVIINVQQTRLDGLAALRIFATCDEVSKLLAAELKLDVKPPPPVKQKHASAPNATNKSAGHASDVWEALPYDPSTGERHPAGESRDAAGNLHRCAAIDMRVGRRVRLVHGNDRASSNSAPAGLEGVVRGKTVQGHYMIDFDDGKARCLGRWMLDAVKDGKLEQLPLLNV